MKFWRWCRYKRRSREDDGEGTLKYRLQENCVFLNSPQISVREKRIGREKYIRQSNARRSLLYFLMDALLCLWQTNSLLVALEGIDFEKFDDSLGLDRSLCDLYLSRGFLSGEDTEAHRRQRKTTFNPYLHVSIRRTERNFRNSF